jgi:hypothetical protein
MRVFGQLRSKRLLQIEKGSNILSRPHHSLPRSVGAIHAVPVDYGSVVHEDFGGTSNNAGNVIAFNRILVVGGN